METVMADESAAPVETPAETPEAPDQFDKLMQGFESFKTDLDQRLGKVEQALTVPEEEYEEPEPEGLTDADYDQAGGLTPEAAQRELQRMIREEAQKVAQEQIRPIQEQRAAERRASEADDIEARYPELQDEKVLKSMVDLCATEAQALGRPELAAEPRFFEKVYLAAKAGESAVQPSADGADREVGLESAGGASAGEEEADDLGDRIVKAASRRNLFG
jgi:hypothetical protein